MAYDGVMQHREKKKVVIVHFVLFIQCSDLTWDEKHCNIPGGSYGVSTVPRSLNG